MSTDSQTMGENEVDDTATFGVNAIWTVARKIFSTILTLAALSLIIYAIGMNYAALPGHWGVQYALFVFVIVLLGYLEGLQIAILELEKSRLPNDEVFKKTYRRGIATLKLATRDKGLNVQRFLIGRQFFVVFVVFLCAQLTTYPNLPKDGWPEWLFVAVIDTGLPGALVVLAFGQLMPQLIAASHPLKFMNLPLSWSVVKLALLLESIGIAHFSWVLSSTVKYCLGWKKYDTNHPDPLREALRTPTSFQEVDESEALVFRQRGDSLSVSSADAVNIAAFQAAELGREEEPRGQKNKDGSSNGAQPPWIAQHGASTSKYKDWGYNWRSGAPFPSPDQIVSFLVEQNKRVPRYLLPPSHPKHIPPHVVAYDLLQHEDMLERKCLELEMKVKSYKQMIAHSKSSNGPLEINGRLYSPYQDTENRPPSVSVDIEI